MNDHVIQPIVIHSTNILNHVYKLKQTFEVQRLFAEQERSLHRSNRAIDEIRGELERLTTHSLYQETALNEYKISNSNLKTIANDLKKDISNKNMEIFMISNSLDRQKKHTHELSKSLEDASALINQMVDIYIKINLDYDNLHKLYKQSHNEVKEDIKDLTKTIIKSRGRDYIATLIDETIDNVIKATTYRDDYDKAIRFKTKFEEKKSLGDNELLKYLNKRLSNASSYGVINTSLLKWIITLVELSIDAPE